ncbi:MAG: DUF3570 domain-containing protein [Burkholderiaceae bacterium]
MAVTKMRNGSYLRHLLRRLAALLGSLLAAGGARAVDLPEDSADAMFHYYSGGGVTASGPALLVRKKLADKVSLSASYYVDSVSNASIDVVTTASPYREVRKEYGLGLDYVYRDSKITLSMLSSREPDYTANSRSIDVSQETFGGMTTVSLGFTQGNDTIGKHNEPTFADIATHWQYRLGVTQILTPRWIMSANAEAIADAGYLGSPYRTARVFGAFIQENVPRTRSSRAVKFRLLGSLNTRDAVHIDYRYFWDNWDIKAHTAEIGYSRYVGNKWLVDTSLRYYTQGKALFYSDDAPSQTTYYSRNRQLGTFDDVGLGAKASYTYRKVPGQYEIKFNAAYEFAHYMFKDFTNSRTGSPYSYNANIFQLFVSATF